MKEKLRGKDFWALCIAIRRQGSNQHCRNILRLGCVSDHVLLSRLLLRVVQAGGGKAGKLMVRRFFLEAHAREQDAGKTKDFRQSGSV